MPKQRRPVIKKYYGKGTAVVGHAEASADIPRAVREEAGRKRFQWRVKWLVVRGTRLLGCFGVDIAPSQRARECMRSRRAAAKLVTKCICRNHGVLPSILCFHGAVTLDRDVAQALEARTTCNLARAEVAVGLELGPWTLCAEEREALGRWRRAISHVGVQPAVATLCFRVGGKHSRVPIWLCQKIDVNWPAIIWRCAIWHRVERPCAKYVCVSWCRPRRGTLVASCANIESRTSRVVLEKRIVIQTCIYASVALMLGHHVPWWLYHLSLTCHGPARSASRPAHDNGSF